MGMNDHRKQWNFVVSATAQACEQAFMETFDGGRLGKKGSFDFARTEDPRNGPHLVARYLGRRGFGAVGSSISRTVADLEERAQGSQIAFAVESDGTPGSTRCTMWLKSRGTVMGVGTADVTILRAYMQDVAKSLTALDPGLHVSKN